MTKIFVSEDCGNSPKNIFVQDLTIAFGKADVKFLLNSASEDIRWNIVGNTLIEGKEEFAESLKGMQKAAELTVLHVATHGKAGAANGTLKTATGKTFGFCDIYEFGNTKGTGVREITTYLIEITRESLR